MPMSLYEIAFSGQLLPGARLEQVEANLSKLFQADAQRIAQLFSGRRIVIKQNLDFAAVEKYRQAMERAGAQVEVRPMPVDVEEIEPGATACRSGTGALRIRSRAPAAESRTARRIHGRFRRRRGTGFRHRTGRRRPAGHARAHTDTGAGPVPVQPGTTGQRHERAPPGNRPARTGYLAPEVGGLSAIR